MVYEICRYYLDLCVCMILHICWLNTIIASNDLQFRLLLKAGCAPCLAGCRWYGICTKWVENLLFEVILMALSSVFRPETWRTRFFHQKHCLEVKNDVFLEKYVTFWKGMFFSEPFPLFKGPGRAHMGPLWIHMDPTSTEKYIKKSPY